MPTNKYEITAKPGIMTTIMLNKTPTTAPLITELPRLSYGVIPSNSFFTK